MTTIEKPAGQAFTLKEIEKVLQFSLKFALHHLIWLAILYHFHHYFQIY